MNEAKSRQEPSAARSTPYYQQAVIQCSALPDIDTDMAATGVGTGKRCVVKSEFTIPLTPTTRLLGASNMIGREETRRC